MVYEKVDFGGYDYTFKFVLLVDLSSPDFVLGKRQDPWYIKYLSDFYTSIRCENNAVEF